MIQEKENKYWNFLLSLVLLNNMDELNIHNIDPELLEEMKKIVVARIRTSSDDLVITIGDIDLNKQQVLESVEKGDEIGLEIIDTQMEFLRDMASGRFYEQNA